MNNQATWIAAVFVCVAALGCMLPFWPLSALGVVLLSLWGRWFVALILGLMLDLAWGAPLGLWHYLYFPFALLAVVSALVRLFASKYFIDRDLPDRL